MRVVAMLLTVAALLGSVIDAGAQPGGRPAAGTTTAPGGTTNSNTVSSGSNRNTNANSNSQFLSGSNTGVNNGSLEIYTGGGAYEGFVTGGSTNLPQLPGILSPPSNFSQPYRPDAFVNTPPFLPTEMTADEAKRCRDAKASWYGGSRDGEAPSIKLFYPGKPEALTVALTMANYVGTVMATTADGPFLAALCEAAYRAMRKGATVGVVEFNIRPKNTMFGLGFGASGGATGLPAAGAHPYALAATLGFGTGWSNQRVEGEVVLQLTAMRGPSVAAAEPTSSAPTSSAPSESASPSERPAPPAVVDDPPAPGPGASSSVPYPSAAPRILLTSATAASEVKPTGSIRRGAAVTRDEAPPEPRRPEEASGPAAAASVASAPGPEDRRTLTHHSAKRLVSVRSGQAKDDVFGIFAGTFTRQGETTVETQGMRLQASGQSAAGARVEVSDVMLVGENARATSYWFLFEEGRLLAWGRAEQWGAAAIKHGVDLPYRPLLRPLQVEAKADLTPGR